LEILLAPDRRYRHRRRRRPEEEEEEVAVVSSLKRGRASMREMKFRGNHSPDEIRARARRLGHVIYV